MLTKRQNFLETIRGGSPDRFVKQFEAFGFVMGDPRNEQIPTRGGEPVADTWGVTQTWVDGTPGPFPIHTPEFLVLKDIENWEDYVKAPRVKFSAAEWEPYIQKAESVGRDDKFLMAYVKPGIFERIHYLSEITNAMLYLITNPDEMRELIRCLTEWELELADEICTYIKPEGVFHHDDWGTQTSTFMSPDMFADYFVEPYKQLYRYYKSRGASLVVHHSDSYAATLVPYMIEMGIDVWQGALIGNDIPTLVDKYGGQISFMGGIDSGLVDRPDWTPESIEQVVRNACSVRKPHYFIPSDTQGGPRTSFTGVHECIDEKIDLVSEEFFTVRA